MELNKNHRLYMLAEVIDWLYLEARIKQNLEIKDSTKFRLITGLLYMKSMTGMTSEEVLEVWATCPHLRYFCGSNPADEVVQSPYLPGVLDMWDREYSGKPYDAMTYALFRASVFDRPMSKARN